MEKAIRRNRIVVMVALLLAAAMPASSQDDRQTETIDATAMGTSTQTSQTVSIKVTINQFSTPEDRQILVDAFKRARVGGWSTHSPK